MGFIKISDLFTRFRRSEILFELEAGGDPLLRLFPGGAANIPDELRRMLPQLIGGMIGNEVLPQTPTSINLATLFYIWWQGPAHRRVIYRVRPETAAHLARVNLGFLPEIPPGTWCNGAIVLESTRPGQPLVADYACIGAYYIQDQAGDWRYFFIGLRYPDGIDIWGTRADFGRLNERLARDGGFMDLPLMAADGVAPDSDAQLAMIKFVFACSYYIEHDKFDIEQAPGPPLRNARGKVIKRGGRKQSLWTYTTLMRPETRDAHLSIRSPLDKKYLALEPTIVAPHIRRYGDKIIVVDTYDSHRWRRQTMGKKTTI